jgi:curved DNA-binding protein CbpA
MKYFNQCKSIEEAKKHYRELLKQYHPDHAGQEGEEITKEIIKQFNAFLNNFMSQSFNSYYADKDWKPDEGAETPFQEILQKIINLDCEIEIIGYWIYCFNSYEVREQLREMGFWFTAKHKAWVYSGRAKRNITSRETLDEIRAKKGSQKIEKKEQEKEKYPLKPAV